MTIKTIVVYPDEGFAILEDESGRFITYKDTDKIESLDDSAGDFMAAARTDFIYPELQDNPGITFKLSQIM